MIYEGSPLYYIYDMIDKKQITDALSAIEERLRMDSTSPDLYNLRGACYYELGRYREALESFSSSLQLYDRDFYPYEMKGKCHFYLEDYIESIDAFDAASQRMNNSDKKVDLLLSAGFAALIASDVRADQYFPKAIELNSRLTIDAIQQIFEKIFLDPLMGLTIEEKLRFQGMINGLREDIDRAKDRILKLGVTKVSSVQPPAPPSIPSH